jgi:hypothetical protein
MRTTVRIDDDVFRELKEQAHREGISMAKLFDRAIRLGLQALQKSNNLSRKPYREKPFSTGAPLIDISKVRQFLDDEDAEEFRRKMQEGL